MGITILVRQHLYIEMRTPTPLKNSNAIKAYTMMMWRGGPGEPGGGGNSDNETKQNITKRELAA